MASNIRQALGTGPAPPWINELHYDNDGTDLDEFIEVALPVAGPVGPGRYCLPNHRMSRDSSRCRVRQQACLILLA